MMSHSARKASNGSEKVSHGVGKVLHEAGKVSHVAGKVSHGAGKVSNGAGKVSHGAGKLSHGAGKVSHGAGKGSHGAKCYNLANISQTPVSLLNHGRHMPHPAKTTLDLPVVSPRDDSLLSTPKKKSLHGSRCIFKNTLPLPATKPNLPDKTA